MNGNGLQVYLLELTAKKGSKFKAVLAQMINKTYSKTLHECMGLVFKLNYQVQQLELYVVNSAYFLLCSAQGEMGKMQTQAQEGLM